MDNTNDNEPMETTRIPLENAHPGVILLEEFLRPLGITAYRFAKATGISQSHLSDLLKARRNVTPETAIRIGAATGTSPEMWLGMQNHYSLLKLRRAMEDDPIDIPRLLPASR